MIYVAGSGLKSITIPETVETLENYAFIGISSLESVDIKKGVKFIGDSAFARCRNLTSVTIKPGIKIIEEYAFAGTAITDLEVPSGVISIGENAFYKIQHVTYHGSASGTPWGALSIN